MISILQLLVCGESVFGADQQASLNPSFDMKKLFFLLNFGLFSIFNLEAAKIKGQIIYEKETVEVMFNIPVQPITKDVIIYNLQFKIKYYNDK